MKLGGNLLGQTCFPFLEIAVTKALDQSDGTVLQSYGTVLQSYAR